jgi:hypothetical protein
MSGVPQPGAAAARATRSDTSLIAPVGNDLGERGDRPGRPDHDEQPCGHGRGRAQPPEPPGPAKIRTEPFRDRSGSMPQPDGRWLKEVPYRAGHGEHPGKQQRPPARPRGGLTRGYLGPDPVQPVAGRLDGIGSQPQRMSQGPV